MGQGEPGRASSRSAATRLKAQLSRGKELGADSVHLGCPELPSSFCSAVMAKGTKIRVKSM